MADKQDFQVVFERLKLILKPFEERFVVQADEPGNYYLNTNYVRDDGYSIFFGAVQIKKNYVSFHLMPIYAFPDLLDGASSDLKKRMQGKSCFNFTRVDDALLNELADLTQRSIDRFSPETMAQWMQAKPARSKGARSEEATETRSG